MGQFTIVLSNNQPVNVRWGTIKKKSGFLGLFKKDKLYNETKKGYIVTFDSASKHPKQYRLLKNNQGSWTSDSGDGFLVSPDDDVSTEIKNAIDSYESQH